MTAFSKDVLDTARHVMVKHTEFHLRQHIEDGHADKGTTMTMLCRAIAAEREKLARLVEAAEALLRRDELNTCQHENTHRGGGIWEICDDCGEKWSDDRNPKKKWRDPPEWVAVRAAIAAAKGGV